MKINLSGQNLKTIFSCWKIDILSKLHEEKFQVVIFAKY